MNAMIVCNDPATDPGIALVVAALGRRGADALLVRADRLPHPHTLSVSLDDPPRCFIDNQPVPPVAGVWLRHAEPGAALPAALSADVAAAVRTQWHAALTTFLDALDAPVFDPPDVLNGAPYKPGQLAAARRLGMRAPRTLVTSDAAHARAFAASCPGGVVTKMVESVRVERHGDGQPVGGFTRALAAGELDDAASLALCPMIFQERVPKTHDVRVTVVGERLFVASIASGETLDWRSDDRLLQTFAPDELPPDTAAAVRAYCDRYDLHLAAFDFARTRDGEHVFLEANTTAYFHFVEQAAGLRIADAVADLLLGRRATARAAGAR